MLGLVMAQLASRDLSQLVVDERKHAIECVRGRHGSIAAANR